MILRGESAEPDPSGNLFLTNVHQLYESRDQEWTAANAVEAMLGPKPKDLASHERSMLERLKGLKDLVVLNDEAHHVHDEDLAWSQSLMSIHESLPKGMRACHIEYPVPLAAGRKELLKDFAEKRSFVT